MKPSTASLPTTADGRFDALAYIREKASLSGIEVPVELLPAVAALLEAMASGANSLDCAVGPQEQRGDQN